MRLAFFTAAAIVVLAISSNGVDVARSEALTMSITIRGVCLDDGAKRIAGASIRLFQPIFRSRSGKLIAETTSDVDGKFAFSDVRPTDEQSSFHLELLATATGHVSGDALVDLTKDEEIVLRLSSRTGTFSGVVIDEAGRPLQGVTVFGSPWFEQPIPGFKHAVTDEAGRFAIRDVYRCPDVDERPANKPIGSFFCAGPNIRMRRSDFAVTTARCKDASREVTLTLLPPGIVTGRVIDEVNGKPLAGAVVFAQGIVSHNCVHTIAAADGSYRLLLNKDHYNFWAEATDRVGIELKAVEVKQGETQNDANIHLFRGGFVSGIVRDDESDRPIFVTQGRYCSVDVFGPGRSRSRSVSNAVAVNSDGSFRVRVAPGRNYLSFGGGAATDYVDVQDGQELKFDLELGRRVDRDKLPNDDPELSLATKLMREAN